MNCPHCKMSNRQADENCYNCDKSLHEGPDLDEQGVPADQPQLHGGPPPGKVKRSYVERSDRSSTLIQGLRSGAVAGLAWGVFSSGFKTAWGGTLIAGISTDTAAGFVGAMGGFFLACLLFNVVYGVILGAILGVTQRLCYQSDAMWLGGIFGGAFGLLNGAFLSFWWWHAPLGAAAGAMISFVERSWFRNQYTQM